MERGEEAGKGGHILLVDGEGRMIGLSIGSLIR